MIKRRAPALAAAVSLVVAFGCGKEKTDRRADGDASHGSQSVITSPVGFVWKWEGTQTPVERVVPTDPTRYTIEFLPDSTVAAQLDCNYGGASYLIDGRSIRITPFTTTLIGCPEGSLGGVFSQQVESARAIYFRGDSLFLDLFADSGTMTFSQLPEPPRR